MQPFSVSISHAAALRLESWYSTFRIDRRWSFNVDYCGVRTTVHSDTDEVRRHLTDVLGTHMAISPCGPDVVSGNGSTVVASAHRVRSELLELFRDGSPLEIFPLRDSPLTMSGVALATAEIRWIWSRMTDSIIRVDPGCSNVTVLGPAPQLARMDPLLGSSIERDVLRVVRDCLHFSTQERGALVCHAAALDIAGRGIAVASSRRGGKTTFVTKILAGDGQTRGRFVSGDRILLQRAAGTFSAYGWPSYTNIGLGTVVASPRLHCLVAPSDGDLLTRRLSADEVHRKILVHHREYQRILSFEVSPRAPLRALVFPVRESTGLRPRRLAFREAEQRIRENIEELIATEEANWLGCVIAPDRGAQRHSATHALASEIPMYVVGTPDILTASPADLSDYANLILSSST